MILQSSETLKIKLSAEYHIKNFFVPTFSLAALFVFQAMKSSPKEKFLIDGFPRNKNNLDGWNNMMTDKVNLLGVLFFDCPEDVSFLQTKKNTVDFV